MYSFARPWEMKQPVFGGGGGGGGGGDDGGYTSGSIAGVDRNGDAIRPAPNPRTSPDAYENYRDEVERGDRSDARLVASFSNATGERTATPSTYTYVPPGVKYNAAGVPQYTYSEVAALPGEKATEDGYSAYYDKYPSSSITPEQYKQAQIIRRVVGLVAAPLGLGINTVTKLQARGILPAADPQTMEEFMASQDAMGDQVNRYGVHDGAIDEILNNANLSDAQKDQQVRDYLNSALAADSVEGLEAVANEVRDGTQPGTIFDDPASFYQGLQGQTPQMDPNAAGTIMSSEGYQMDPTTGEMTAILGDTSTASGVLPQQPRFYDAARATDTIMRMGQGTAAQGTVSDASQIDAEDVVTDMQGAATGTNEDGSINYLGMALNDWAAQGLTVIDTSTVSGQLLAQQMGEGNYVDAKATVEGQLKLLSEQFTDPNTGEPTIPPWAAGVARNVSRIAAFKGMTGTAATAAMSQAIMEASLPIAMEDARFFQTLTVTNLNNRQQMTVNKANVLAKMELANMDARMTAAVENSKSFLQMDLANLSNRQQMEVVNTQARVQSILEDARAENAARMFRADAQNDFAKFYDNLNSQINMFNTEQLNAMERFNAGEVNDASEFNARMEMAREQFYKEMQYNVDLANARWRQTVETQNTGMQFEAARMDVQNLFDMSQEAMNRMWDREDALLDYAWKSSETALDREVRMYVADRQAEAAIAGVELQEEIYEGQSTMGWLRLGFDAINGDGSFLGMDTGSMFDWF